MFLFYHSKLISEFNNTELSTRWSKLIVSCNISPYVCTTKNLYYILLKMFNTCALQSSVLITDLDSRDLNDGAY